ncbi:quinone oxidoreductase putative [Pisolithus orientalis]|uniref:quinone oxidoreductase putative n=1 Tax=Pisolithus orientalis TaxID=936130 RepID=UPI002223FA71|nr:quinone oxidoreductase putative [Pisolithus orientalis]KAI6030830.1 quinone oxidoreductase putative [Pisolithus orientalis]
MSTMMRAILIKEGKGPIENLYIGEVEKPVLKEGQVLVKIVAFGLNRMDSLQREGNYPLPPGASTILGVEFSGRVDYVEPGVTKWSVGDEVFGLSSGGAYAEYIAADQDLLIRKPPHLSWEDAAGIPENFVTAHQAVTLYGELKRNDNVLVHAGASGVGIAAIQMARSFGARSVTATASNKEKLDWLLSIPSGATEVANYRTEDFSTTVKNATDGRGVDVIVDFVGRTHWEKNIDSLALDGRMTILATLSGEIALDHVATDPNVSRKGGVVPKVDLGPILYKRLKIQGSTLRSRSLEYQSNLINRCARNFVEFPKVEVKRPCSAAFQDVVSKITGSEGDGPMRVYIHKVFPWTEIQAAHKEMSDNKNLGKIVCRIS